MSIETACEISVAAQDSGIAPIVRVPYGELAMATRVLDGGALGIVIPHVDTAEEAKEIADLAYFEDLVHGGVIGDEIGILLHDDVTEDGIGGGEEIGRAFDHAVEEEVIGEVIDRRAAEFDLQALLVGFDDAVVVALPVVIVGVGFVVDGGGDLGSVL